MPRRRDRHDRGLRGPIALPNPYTGRAARLPGRPSRHDFFNDCVSDAVRRIDETCPGGLQGVDIGVQEVPGTDAGWLDDRVPLGVAIEATSVQAARIVVYRRPLEHRCANRGELRDLVHRTMVEQLAALTARHVRDIDPTIDDEDEW